MKKCAKFAYQRLTSDMPADQTPACHPRSHRWSSASVELVSAGDRKMGSPAVTGSKNQRRLTAGAARLVHDLSRLERWCTASVPLV